MAEETVTEFAKNAWAKLYAWALPSALAIGVYWTLVYPRTMLLHDWLDGRSDTEMAGIFAAVTATLAFCLNAFSTPLYRILEGYLLWPRFLQTRGVARQKRRKQRLEEAQAGSGWARGLALEKLALYPQRDDQIVPTRFGNALRSFETYGKTRFNLDSQTLWNELLAVAPKYIQTALEDARSSVDFFVASIYLSAAFGVLTLLAGAVEGLTPGLAVIGGAGILVSILCHWLVVRTTRDWSLAVQALVNVGRPKLALAMGLRLPDSLAGEKRMWGLVTRYVFFARPLDGAALDAFRQHQDAVMAAPEPGDDADELEGG
jgi:hypothetical protein